MINHRSSGQKKTQKPQRRRKQQMAEKIRKHKPKPSAEHQLESVMLSLLQEMQDMAEGGDAAKAPEALLFRMFQDMPAMMYAGCSLAIDLAGMTELLCKRLGAVADSADNTHAVLHLPDEVEISLSVADKEKWLSMHDRSHPAMMLFEETDCLDEIEEFLVCFVTLNPEVNIVSRRIKETEMLWEVINTVSEHNDIGFLQINDRILADPEEIEMILEDNTLSDKMRDLFFMVQSVHDASHCNVLTQCFKYMGMPELEVENVKEAEVHNASVLLYLLFAAFLTDDLLLQNGEVYATENGRSKRFVLSDSKIEPRPTLKVRMVQNPDSLVFAQKYRQQQR